MKGFFFLYNKLDSLLLSIKRFVWQYKLCRIAKSYESKPYVGGPSYFEGDIYLGENCNFNGMRVTGGGSVIFGSNFHSGIECMIITQNHDYDNGDCIPYGRSYVLKRIVIKDNVWMGNRVTVVGNVVIGEGSVIAAGAVVTKDVPDFAIVGGNPAKVLRYRDKVHYLKLKDAKKYY